MAKEMEAIMLRLLWQELIFRRNAIIGWGLGLCFFPVVYIGIYPSVAEEMAGLADLEIYQAMGVNLSSFADWIGSILVLFLPLVAAIYTLINGTSTLAGEEEDGRMELLVTLPLPRWQIVTAKALALIIATIAIYAIVSLVTLITFGSIESQLNTELTGMDVVMAMLAGWPLLFAFTMISMFLAAFSPSRRIASLIAAALLIISYFGDNLANSTSELEPFEPFFLFSYLDTSGQAVIAGQQTGDTLVLLLIGAIAFLLTLFFFQRRDLTVGVWPWQRARVGAE